MKDRFLTGSFEQPNGVAVQLSQHAAPYLAGCRYVDFAAAERVAERNGKILTTAGRKITMLIRLTL